MAQVWRPASLAGALRRFVLCVALAAAVGVCARSPSTAIPRTTGRYVLAACSGVAISDTVPTDYFSPPSGLRIPGDGRLNGLDFSLVVLGYADQPCIASSQSGMAGMTAAPGESVALVSYRLDTGPDWDTTETTHLAFVVNGKAVPILGADYSAGWNRWALAVPKSASVGFEVIDAGSSQELSLGSGKRVTASPLALYRSSNDSQVSERIDKTVTLEDVDRARHFSQPDELELLSADLSWFSPADPLVHGGMHGAFLQLNLAEEAPPKYFEVGWSESLPPGRMRLVLPGGRVLAPDPASTSSPNPSNLLSGTYFFDVPWDVTRGTLELTPGTIPALSTANGAPMDVTVSGTASFPISLPPARAFKAATGAVRHSHAKPPAPAGGSARPGHSVVATVIVIAVSSTLVVLVPVILLIPVFVRRRQRRLGPYAYDAGGEPIEPALVGTPAVETAAPSAAEEADGTGEPSEETGAPGALPRPAPYIAVMGEVGIRDLELPTKRLIAIEILCFLACQKPRRFSPEELRSELWPLADDGTEKLADKTFRTYVTAARRAAGRANFPKVSGHTYGLGEAVETDWHSFQRLVERSSGLEGPERRQVLDEALLLVRGPLFSGVPDGRYEWALSGGLVSEISVAIIEAAGAFANSCLEGGVPGEALAGLTRALVATKDTGVGDDLLTAAGATGNPATVERAWEEILANLGKNASLLQRSYEAIRNRLAELDSID